MGQDREARSLLAQDDDKTIRDLSGGWWDSGDTDKCLVDVIKVSDE